MSYFCEFLIVKCEFYFEYQSIKTCKNDMFFLIVEII